MKNKGPIRLFTSVERAFLSGLILLLLVYLPDGYTQSVNFQSISTADGLPGEEVFCIDQDSMGYLWIGTENGVSKFDGRSFQNFSTKDGIPNNIVFQVLVDNEQRVWVNNLRGKQCFIFQDSVHLPPFPDTFQNKYFFYSDFSDNRLAILFKNNRLQLLDSSLTPYSQPIFSSQTSPLLKIKDTVYVPIRSGGILLHTSQKYTPMDLPDVYQHRDIIKCDRYKGYLACLLRSQEEDKNQLHFTLLPSSKKNLLCPPPIDLDSFGQLNSFQTFGNELWLCLDNGLLKVEQSRHDPLEFTFKKLISNVFINDIFKDQGGNYWIGTEGDGLLFLPNTAIRSMDLQESCRGSVINTVLALPDGDIAVGFNNGFLALLSNFQLKYELKLDNNRITGILCEDSTLWVSSNDRLFQIDKATGRILQNRKVVGPLKSLRKEGASLYLFSNTVERFRENRLQQIDRYLDLRIYANTLLEDSTLLLGSIGGIFSVNTQDFQFEGPWMPEIEADIRAFAQLPDGGLGIATAGRGVFIVNHGRISKHFEVKDGLPSDICTSIVYKKGKIWIGTNQGLARIHYPDLSVDFIQKKDGLSDSQVKCLSATETHLLAATNHNLNYVPFEYDLNRRAPRVHFQEMTINKTAYSLPPDQPVKYYQNDIRFRFNAIADNLLSPVRYAYRLKGRDNSWQFSKIPEANYSNLPHGRYTFQVKSRSPSTDWSDATEVSVTIMRPWYLSTWALGLGTLLFLALMSSIVMLSLYFSKQKNERKERLLYYQLTALRAQMNPHFIFNAFNSIQDFINRNDRLNANLYLSKFATLLRHIIQNAEKDYIRLEEEIKQLNRYLDLEQLRLGKDFTFRLSLNQMENTHNIYIPTMIIQPHVENAIIHGLFHKKGAKTLIVNFEKMPTAIKCTIQDDGIGREKAGQLKKSREPNRNSIGVRNTRDRLMLINRIRKGKIQLFIADLYDDQARACGTRVEIHLPFKTL